MRILAFESSAKAASAAILADGSLLGEAYLHTGLTHSRTLLQLAEHLLVSCGLTTGEIDAAACAAGPGSFTGVRIGVAAAKGFAWGRGIPCYGVSTLGAMSRHLGGSWNGILCAAMDARRSQVYNALFQCARGTITRLCPDRAISIAELEADLLSRGGPILLVGDGAALCSQTLSPALDLTLAPELSRQQRASGVALEAWEAYQRGEPGDAAALTPTYLRLSQAERERLARLASEAGQTTANNV